jgi:hypothetical protein
MGYVAQFMVESFIPDLPSGWKLKLRAASRLCAGAESRAEIDRRPQYAVF